jgi:MSHA biogenesis protein MshI
VLEKLKAYLQDIIHRQHLFAQDESKVISADEMCSIELSSKAFSIVYARNDKGKLNIVLCATYPYSTSEDLQNSLATIVKYHKLDAVGCIWVLGTEQYQLLLLDALPVPPSEFQAAIRWKIKELIRFPMNDVLIDSFPLPIKKASSAQDMMMVAATKTSELKSMSDRLEQSGLNLNMISILELSLNNVAGLFDQDDKSTALFYIQEKNSQLIITGKKQLHFSRRVELGLAFLASQGVMTDDEMTQKIDRLALEIQRSFDYYQSQWRQPVPARILFASIKALPIDITPLLSQHLSIPVEQLDLGGFFANPKVLSTEDQGKYLPIIGALINSMGDGNAAKN